MTQLEDTPRITIENNILKGREVTYRHNYASLGKFVLDSLEKDLDFVGQVDAVTGKEYTYRKTRERSVRCALWMKAQGILPRDVVVLCCDDHLDFEIPCFAALYLGAIFSPWDETLNAEEFLHMMNVSKPKMVFASERSAAAIAEAAKMAELDLQTIVFGHVPGFLDFESVLAEHAINEVEKFESTEIESLNEIASIMFSSGSTGSPKGVAISHGSLMMLIRESEILEMAGHICMHFTPTHWLAIMDSMFTTISLKTVRIILPEFEEYSACALIEKYQPSWVMMTPWIINRLVKSAAASRYDLSSMTKVIHTGFPLSTSSHEALVKLVPKAQIFTLYGLTETCCFIALQSTGSKPGSSGTIKENTQLKVIDPDTGRILAPNQRGEILIRSLFRMSFYYNDPQKTSEAIDEDGWLHTGDFGYYDEDGEIYVIDRLKDIIRCEWYDICPSEIESLILSHPGVKEVAVVGQPREQDADLMMAFVVREENSSDTSKQITEEDIVNLVATEVPTTFDRQLWGGVRFIDELPKTSTNKIRRIELRRLAKSSATISSNYVKNSSITNSTLNLGGINA